LILKKIFQVFQPKGNSSKELCLAFK
jgi:hypothetical protein